MIDYIEKEMKKRSSYDVHSKTLLTAFAGIPGAKNGEEVGLASAQKMEIWMRYELVQYMTLVSRRRRYEALSCCFGRACPRNRSAKWVEIWRNEMLLGGLEYVASAVSDSFVVASASAAQIFCIDRENGRNKMV